MPALIEDNDYIYVLRTSDKDGRSYGGFQWPKEGYVSCPDWDPKPECGHGLHGFAKGEGDHNLISNPSGLWQVVKVLARDIVDLTGKCKYPAGVVVYSGEKNSAIALIQKAHPESACMYGKATAGDCGQATAGYNGQATAGYNGQATAGDYGQATAGDCGQATAGDCGQATAGYNGQATAGDGGQATAGDCGQATAGDYGQATAGDGGIINICWHDGKRYRLATGYVGEGVEANVPYKVVGGKLVKV